MQNKKQRNQAKHEGKQAMSRQRDLIDMMESRLFSGLSEAECSAIYSWVRPARIAYRKKETIIEQGEKINYVSIIIKGKIIGIRYYYGGDSHILRIFNQMDILSLEAAMSSFQKSPVTLMADEASEVLNFSLTRLMDKSILDEAGMIKFHRNIMHLLADENIRLIYKAEVLSKKALRERIMIFLRIMSEKKGKDAFFIGMNQDQFAQYLCANRSSLSSELNNMRKEGLIDYDKDYFRILEKESNIVIYAEDPNARFIDTISIRNR